MRKEAFGAKPLQFMKSKLQCHKLADKVTMYLEMPDMAVEAIDAFFSESATWDVVRKGIKVAYPKMNKVCARRMLGQMMSEIENDEYAKDPTWVRGWYGTDEPFDKYFPKWSKFRRDMDAKARKVGMEYHSFVSAELF